MKRLATIAAIAMTLLIAAPVAAAKGEIVIETIPMTFATLNSDTCQYLPDGTEISWSGTGKSITRTSTDASGVTTIHNVTHANGVATDQDGNSYHFNYTNSFTFLELGRRSRHFQRHDGRRVLARRPRWHRAAQRLRRDRHDGFHHVQLGRDHHARRPHQFRQVPAKVTATRSSRQGRTDHRGSKSRVQHRRYRRRSTDPRSTVGSSPSTRPWSSSRASTSSSTTSSSCRCSCSASPTRTP